MQTEPSKADPPKRKRRRFQFSLRTLLFFCDRFIRSSRNALRIWTRLFATIESRPEWGWICVVLDDGSSRPVVATKWPPRFVGR